MSKGLKIEHDKYYTPYHVVKDGLLVKIGNDYYSKEIITLLYDKGFVQSINLD